MIDHYGNEVTLADCVIAPHRHVMFYEPETGAVEEFCRICKRDYWEIYEEDLALQEQAEVTMCQHEVFVVEHCREC